jgi:hypothetical protein
MDNMRRLFSRPGRFYKGNVHAHSTRSDGKLSPEEVVAAYRDRGYDFLVLTDHFLQQFDYPITDTRPFRAASFTTLLGAELHAPRIASGLDWHLVSAGLPIDFSPPALEETGPMLAARAAEAGAFIGLAHPARYQLTLEDALSVEAAHAVEVYNHGSAQWNDRGESWYLCDLLLSRGRRITAYAADDAHFIGSRPAAFAAWTQVWAEELTPEALLAALKEGSYYSSQGPELHSFTLNEGEITVTSSPCEAILLSGPSAHAWQARGEALTSATFSLEGFERAYCRITLIDAKGKRAWSNPIWLD